MNVKFKNSPIEGAADVFGVELRKRDYLCRVFADVIRRYGYEQIEVPIIERASSFSEEIVGQSPWPEWDKRGCFYLKVNNYTESFNKVSEQVDALLIPEGTIPVTRWLGGYLEQNVDIILPLKIFYMLPCFRNELLNSLSKTKKRQFNQFGLEILGSESLGADIETIYLIKRLLTEVGISSSEIQVRLSNVGIFNKLVAECAITHKDSILLKEAMDTIAECRAGKKPERLEMNRQHFEEIIDKYLLSSVQLGMWGSILNHSSGIITSDMYEIFSDQYRPYLDELTLLCNELRQHDVNSLLDLCVVRSHEYYTGISFEVDVKVNNEKFVEIAGGGRYDKLVGNFVSSFRHTVIPSTGFAFGLERVITMLEQSDRFDKRTVVNSILSFETSTADEVLQLSESINPVDQYFKAVKIIEKNRATRYDVYFGELGKIQAYADQNGATVVRNV